MVEEVDAKEELKEEDSSEFLSVRVCSSLRVGVSFDNCVAAGARLAPNTHTHTTITH